MKVNFSEDCVALPDLEQRSQRGYESDAWMSEVREADLEILWKEAQQLDAEGYVSMLPYFSGCKRLKKKGQLGVWADCLVLGIFGHGLLIRKARLFSMLK